MNLVRTRSFVAISRGASWLICSTVNPILLIVWGLLIIDFVGGIEEGLEFVAGAEADGTVGGEREGLAGAEVAGGAGGDVGGGEGAEAADGDFFAAGKRLFDDADGAVDGFDGGGEVEVVGDGEFFREFVLCHGGMF